MLTVYKNKYECCGCGMCAKVCPQKAIRMQIDEKGYIYPSINQTLCVDCHLCEKSCAYGKWFNETEGHSFAGMNVDAYQRQHSTSAGIFAALATSILSNGGVVCGAIMIIENGQSTVKHILIEDITTLHKMQGSKYVQSDISECYEEILKALKVDKKVLFSGTPCQVSAIKEYTKNYTDNLYTVDLICHGVPSNSFFNDFLKSLSALHGGIVSEFKFRDKSKGWGLKGTAQFTSVDGKKNLDFIPDDLSYYRLFLDGEIYRDSCYKCPYTQTKRTGDITIGDYWGAAKYSPELMESNGGPFTNEEGVSCVLVNSNKGSELIKKVSSNNLLLLEPVEIEKILFINKQLRQPAVHSQLREKVFAEYKLKGYAGVSKVYKSYCAKKKVRHVLGKIIPHSIKTHLKR